jgi:hypothetical protein
MEGLRIDDKMQKRIRQPLTELQANATQPGYVYIFRDPARPSLLKIGRAKQVYERHEQIKSTCIPGLTVQHKGLPIFAEQRVELLCHDELDAFRRPYECSVCKKPNGQPRVHNEWFEVSEADALQVIENWTNFMLAKPYGEDGKLEGFWQDWINNPHERYLTREEACTAPIDFESRREHWLKFCSVDWYGKSLYRWRYFSQNRTDFEYWRSWYFSLFVFSAFLIVLFGFVLRLEMYLFHFFVSLGYVIPVFLVRSRSKVENQRRRSVGRRKSTAAE